MAFSSLEKQIKQSMSLDHLLLTSLVSEQILHNQIGSFLCVTVSTPHLPQTVCENKANKQIVMKFWWSEKYKD